MADVDVDRIAEDLAGVEVALARLDEGTYWTCEVSGEELPDEVLAADPVTRRVPELPSSR
jgi:RNA polymerase-binding transcription factor DksA